MLQITGEFCISTMCLNININTVCVRALLLTSLAAHLHLVLSLTLFYQQMSGWGNLISSKVFSFCSTWKRSGDIPFPCAPIRNLALLLSNMLVLRAKQGTCEVSEKSSFDKLLPPYLLWSQTFLGNFLCPYVMRKWYSCMLKNLPYSFLHFVGI